MKKQMARLEEITWLHYIEKKLMYLKFCCLARGKNTNPINIHTVTVQLHLKNLKSIGKKVLRLRKGENKNNKGDMVCDGRKWPSLFFFGESLGKQTASMLMIALHVKGKVQRISMESIFWYSKTLQVQSCRYRRIGEITKSVAYWWNGEKWIRKEWRQVEKVPDSRYRKEVPITRFRTHIGNEWFWEFICWHRCLTSKRCTLKHLSAAIAHSCLQQFGWQIDYFVVGIVIVILLFYPYRLNFGFGYPINSS